MASRRKRRAEEIEAFIMELERYHRRPAYPQLDLDYTTEKNEEQNKCEKEL